MAMSRAEKRYNWTEDILAWGHGKYTREELNALPLPDLCTIHAEVYMHRMEEINMIRK